MWRTFLCPLACFLLICFPLTAQENGSPTTASNLAYKLSFANWAGGLVNPSGIATVPGESRRAVRVSAGGEELLRACQEHPGQFQRDSLLFRFGHRNPGSTIGCRERSSPSLHLVFYEQPDGSREAWVHFDLHGPHDLFGHATEVMRNRLSFGHTSEHEVYRGLAFDAGGLVPEPRYDTSLHARKYIRDVFSIKAVRAAVASASTTTSLRLITGRGMGTQTYRNRVATNLLRNAVSKSIEFGTAAFLQQDLRFTPSGERGFRRRAGAALYRAFFVPGRQHDELAFPRIATALGTPWVMRPLGAGLGPPAQSPWVQSALILGRYVLKSYWAEFKPEVKYRVRRMLGRE